MRIGKEFAALALTVFSVNALFTLFLFSWATRQDFNDLPVEPMQKLVHLFYFSVTTFTSTGYGDIVPISTRAKIAVTVYMLVIYSLLITGAVQLIIPSSF